MSKMLLALALLPVGSFAYCMEVSDLRLDFGSFSTLDSHDHRNITAGSDSAIYTTGSVDSSNNYSNSPFGEDIKFVYGQLSSYGGLLVSIGFSGWSSYSDAAPQSTSPGPGSRFYDNNLYSETDEFQFGVGYGLPLTHTRHTSSYLEFMADLGVGSMQIDGYDRSLSNGNTDIETASGTEASVGGHIGWFLRFARHYVVGIQVGCSRHFANSLHNSFWTGTHYDESFQETLIDYRLAFGYHF